MGKININRVILGGIVAGVVLDILDYLVDGVMLAPAWTAGMERLGRPAFTASQIVGFNVLGILSGLVVVWLYAAIRPRFGAGLKTAVYAGVAMWIAWALLPNLGLMVIPALFSKHLSLYTTIGNLIEVVAGSIAGAALYKEAEAPSVVPSIPVEPPRQTVKA